MLEEGTERKRIILNTVRDMILDLLIYRRREDEQLPVGAIEEAIRDGEITEDEIVEAFKDELHRGLASAPV